MNDLQKQPQRASGRLACKLFWAVVFIGIGYFLNSTILFFKNFDVSKQKVCTLETGLSGAYIDIYSPTFNEMAISLEYQIRINDQIESPLYRLAYVEEWGVDSADFHVLTGNGGELIGVVFKDEPHVVLALYDFSTREGWPRSTWTESYHETQARGEQLLGRLKQATGQEQLVLND